MRSQINKIELLANVAIIVVALLLGVVLLRSLFLSRPRGQPQPPTSTIQPGTQLSLPGIDWKANGRTLVMGLSTQCHFCTESAQFYQRVAQERSKIPDLRLVAVFPQSVPEGEHYLKNLGVGVDGVKEVKLDSLGLRGTPTLILTNQQGGVIESWFGKLSPSQEQELLERLR